MNPNRDAGDILDNRHAAATATGRWRTFWSRFPARVKEYGIDVIGWGSSAGIVIWESRNATLGFEQLWSPGFFFAFVGGVGVVLGSIFMGRVAAEFFRANKFWPGLVSLVMMFGVMAVTLLGVWSNLAADNVRRGDAQIEVAENHDAIIKSIRTIEAQIRAIPPSVEIQLLTDKDELTQLEMNARQWGLDSLEPGLGKPCDADLKPLARSLCDQAGEVRRRIAMGEASVTLRGKLATDLVAENTRLASAVEARGVEHLQEMASVLGEEKDWKFWGSITTLIASGILLLFAAWVVDIMWERLERRLKKQEPATS